MNVVYPVTVDLNKPRRNVVHLVQGDNTHQISLTLLSNGLPYDVAADAGGATISKSVKYIKANGVDGSYDTTSTGVTAVVAGAAANVWTVTLDEHATDFPGFADVFVVFATASGKILHVFPVVVDVIKATTGETDPGQPYYNNSAFVLVANQISKTSAMTQRVGIDANGRLWVPPGGGGGSGAEIANITITESGGTYSSDTNNEDIQELIDDGAVVQAITPTGMAYYRDAGVGSSNFYGFADLGDALYIAVYSVRESSVSVEMFPIDNALIPQTTVVTISDSTYTVVPAANFQYLFSNPVLSLTISSSYAASGNWSIEFDAPTNVAPSVTIPSGLKTIPASPTFSANHHYEINCNNGYLVVAEW